MSIDRECLRTVSLCHARGGQDRITHVDALFLHGHSYAMIGTENAGANTLCGVIAGEIKADSGQILLEEKPATRKMLRQEVGYIAKSARLLEGLSVYENLYFTTDKQPFLWREPAQRARVQEILTALGLEALVQTPVCFLSPLAQRKIVIIREFLRGKQIILFQGAPESATEQENIQLATVFARLIQRGVCVVYQSNYFDKVAQTLQTALVMDHGTIVKILPQRAATQSVVHAYQYNYRITPHRQAPNAQNCNLLCTIDDVSICSNDRISILDTDGTGVQLLAKLRQEKHTVAVFGQDAATGGLLQNMSVLDNLLLSIAPKASNLLGMISRQMRNMIARECMEVCALTKAQLDALPQQLCRIERIRVLLYRWKLRSARIFVLEQSDLDEEELLEVHHMMSGMVGERAALLHIAEETAVSRMYQKNCIYAKGKLKEVVEHAEA